MTVARQDFKAAEAKHLGKFSKFSKSNIFKKVLKYFLEKILHWIKQFSRWALCNLHFCKMQDLAPRKLPQTWKQLQATFCWKFCYFEEILAVLRIRRRYWLCPIVIICILRKSNTNVFGRPLSHIISSWGHLKARNFFQVCPPSQD